MEIWFWWKHCKVTQNTLIMKCEVTLYKAGTVFKEEVIARDYQDARQVALARNPGATIVGVTAKF